MARGAQMTAFGIYMLAGYFVALLVMVWRLHDLATLESENAIYQAFDQDMDRACAARSDTQARAVLHSFRLFASSRGLL